MLLSLNIVDATKTFNVRDDHADYKHKCAVKLNTVYICHSTICCDTSVHDMKNFMLWHPYMAPL